MAARDSSEGGVASTLTRPEVRTLLDGVLRTDTDLDVFAGDYCNEVYRLFTVGMLRPAKVTLLLDKVPLDRLVEMLRRAHPPARNEAQEVQPVLAASVAVGPTLPAKPPRFIGREELDAKLTGALLEEAPRPVVVLGGAGIGKSTLTISVLHRPEIAVRYGDRRYFVRLDAATTADASVSAIAVAMRLPAGGDPRASVLAALGRDLAVLALDNGETPWEGDRDSTEALLADLAAVPGLALVVSVRGNARPGRVAWGSTLPVQRLDDIEAIDVFCSLVEDARREDPAVASLVKELAGVPLAVTLLGYAAEGCPLSVLAKDWSAQRTALLTRLGSDLDRLSSWAVSIDLSMGSRRMTPAARRMASLLGALPDGVAEGDLDTLLPNEGLGAARVLAQVALAYFESGRLLMLAPVREHIALAHPTVSDDLDRAMEWYGQLASALGGKPGSQGGKDALARLTPETANLDAMIRRGMDGHDPVRWIDAALELRDYSQFSVRPYPSPLARASQVAQAQRETLREANCIRSLGTLALWRSEDDQAQKRFEEARLLFRRMGDVRGEAGCIQNLGEVALAGWDYAEARIRFKEAALLFRKEGAALGEAACVGNLGSIALRLSKHKEARNSYGKALQLFQKVGSLLGQANCFLILGALALKQSHRKEARRRCHRALSLYQQIGDMRGEANCNRSLGDLARRDSRLDEARRLYETALALYTQVSDVFSMGITHQLLASVVRDPVDNAYHVAAARRCWKSIDRQDLVALLDAEFPPTP